jgi:hypothetical protein
MKFKLKDQTELQVSDHVQFYARALRAIGQDLSGFFPQSLEITVNEANFEVTGRYLPRAPLDKADQRNTHLLGRLRDKLRRDGAADEPMNSSGSGPVPFSRAYTPADIDQLDEARARQRGDSNTVPDIYSLGEILRMVGRIIDCNGKRLQRLSRDNYGVSFEYEDAAGKIQKGELSSLQLYKLQQQYYGERGTFVAVDQWKGSI